MFFFMDIMRLLEVVQVYVPISDVCVHLFPQSLAKALQPNFLLFISLTGEVYFTVILLCMTLTGEIEHLFKSIRHLNFLFCHLFIVFVHFSMR